MKHTHYEYSNNVSVYLSKNIFSGGLETYQRKVLTLFRNIRIKSTDLVRGEFLDDVILILYIWLNITSNIQVLCMPNILHVYFKFIIHIGQQNNICVLAKHRALNHEINYFIKNNSFVFDYYRPL